MAKKNFKTAGAMAFISQAEENTKAAGQTPIGDASNEETPKNKESTAAAGTLHSAQELADFLGVTRRTIYSYIHDGKITGLKIGHSWKFTDEQISAFLSNAAENR